MTGILLISFGSLLPFIIVDVNLRIVYSTWKTLGFLKISAEYYCAFQRREIIEDNVKTIPFNCVIVKIGIIIY